jgi:L-cystine uptake protein TcyP (sodium:dicarboxylate symporter family)
MAAPQPPEKSKLTLYIIISLIAGVALGFGLNKSYLSEDNEALKKTDLSIQQVQEEIKQTRDSLVIKQLEKKRKDLGKERGAILTARDEKVEPFSLMADIFLRLIKMIVAPLVFTTLVVGVAKLGDISAVGRIGGKTLLWFLGASLTQSFIRNGSCKHLPAWHCHGFALA